MSVDMESILAHLAAEYGTWDALVRQIQDEDLDADTKARTIRCIRRLQVHLGDNWPADALGNGHPLMRILQERAPWTRQYLCSLADAMDAVADVPRWAGLRSRLRHPDQAAAVMFELELAAQVLGQGLRVELEPETGARCRADLSMRAPDSATDVLFVEAKRLQSLPKRAHDAHDLFEQVVPMRFILMSNLTGGGGFLRAPRQDEIPGLVQRAREFWLERDRDRTPGLLQIDDLLAMWGADRGDREAQEDFVARGYPPAGSLAGPQIELDAFVRIGGAIQNESRQLPTTAGGLIVLGAPAEPSMLDVDAGLIAREIIRMVRPYGHLNAVVLLRQIPAVGPSARAIRALGGGSVLIVSPRDLAHNDEIILVRNPGRRYPSADALIDRLFDLPA